MEVQTWRVQIQTCMSQVKDIDTRTSALKSLCHLLPSDHKKQCKATEFCEDFASARTHFLSGVYSQLLYRLLDVLSDMKAMAEDGSLISQFFVHGVPYVSFEVGFNFK